MSEKPRRIFRCDIASAECKGCERCVAACPKGVLKMGAKLNQMGVPFAVCTGEGCIGCGACFYSCPEPGAITIVEIVPEDEVRK